MAALVRCCCSDVCLLCLPGLLLVQPILVPLLLRCLISCTSNRSIYSAEMVPGWHQSLRTQFSKSIRRSAGFQRSRLVCRMRYASLLQENEARQRVWGNGARILKVRSNSQRGNKMQTHNGSSHRAPRLATSAQRTSHRVLLHTPAALNLSQLHAFLWARRTAPWLTGTALEGRSKTTI